MESLREGRVPSQRQRLAGPIPIEHLSSLLFSATRKPSTRVFCTVCVCRVFSVLCVCVVCGVNIE